MKITLETKINLARELRDQYNGLWEQHNTLPSEIHKHWNMEAMNAINEYLKKLILEIKAEQALNEVKEVNEEATTEAVETVQTEKAVAKKVVKKKAEKAPHYLTNEDPRIEYYKFSIELYAVNEYGNDVKIAHYNADGNTGYWVDLNGKYHHVKRWNTILKNLWKINENYSLAGETYIEKLRKQFEEYQTGLAV